MENPNLPNITTIEPNSPLQLSDNLSQSRTMRSNLKKVLSKEIKTLEDDSLFTDDQNQFILEHNNSIRIITKSIIRNSNLEEPLLTSDTQKKLKFSQTQIHEVENWKKYNKRKHCCCLHFL